MFKKLLLMMTASVMCGEMLCAQTNLREGIVITLQGDTLRGNIEYRTDGMNAKRCSFMQNGQTESRTYLPGEIQGYRYQDNGRYMVSMMVTPDSNSKGEMRFVEYILKGPMNLYYAVNEKVFILETNQGTASFPMADGSKIQTKQERRNELREVFALLSPSKKASDMLWTMGGSVKDVTKMVQAYNDDVCKDGVCEVFAYKSKTMPNEDKYAKWFVRVGADFGTVVLDDKKSDLKNWSDKVSYVTPSVTVGVDMDLKRLAEGLMARISVGYSHCKTQCNEDDSYVACFNQFEADVMDFRLGPGYRYDFGKVKAYVYGGYDLRLYMGSQWDVSSVMVGKIHEEAFRSKEFGMCNFFGTIGVEYPLTKGSLFLDVDYVQSNYGPNDTYADFKFKAFSTNIGYKF